MQKVDFTFKRNGSTRAMPRRQAELLQKLGHGEYMTRVMTPGRAPLPPQAEVPPFASAQTSKSVVVDDLDSLDKDQLHALAKERGVKVHHMAGADKVRAALRE